MNGQLAQVNPLVSPLHVLYPETVVVGRLEIQDEPVFGGVRLEAYGQDDRDVAGGFVPSHPGHEIPLERGDFAVEEGVRPQPGGVAGPVRLVGKEGGRGTAWVVPARPQLGFLEEEKEEERK